MASIEYVLLDSITPPESFTPNESFDGLCAYLRAGETLQPLLVLDDTRQIIDGAQRWHAARTVGLKHVPITKVP